jgi:DnaJ-class molecular chaperone
MAKQKDLYAVLGVSKTASTEEIRKAYRKLARQHHPDVNPGNKQAEELFKDISLANDVLSDPEKRKLYDEFGHEGLQAGFDAARAREYRQWTQSGRGFSFRPGTGESSSFNFGFEMPRGARGRGGAAGERGFADILNEMFGGVGAGEEPAEGGRDIEHPLEVDLLDALRGTQTQVTIRRQVPCKTCGGTGRQGRRACTTCGGTGTVEERQKLTVKIPAGIGDGARVRVAGKGGAGPGGGPAGDLYFVVKIRPHPRIQRDGKDLTIEVPVTVGEAMLGATITVPTPSGRVQVKIPKASQGGQRLRLKGRGVPDPKGGAAGDLYVRLMVQVPADGNGEQLREAVSTIEQAYATNPRAHLTL